MRLTAQRFVVPVSLSLSLSLLLSPPLSGLSPTANASCTNASCLRVLDDRGGSVQTSRQVVYLWLDALQEHDGEEGLLLPDHGGLQ